MAQKCKRYEKKTFIPFASVSPEKISLYARPLDGFSYGHRFSANIQNLSNNDTDGKISKKANAKIERAISYLLFNAKPKSVMEHTTGKRFTFLVNFITLTLPAQQMHSDNEIKKVCLNNFLTVARKNGLKNYVWRAEAQPQTGNIHFHITTDHFIHYNSIRKWWNQSVNLLGYLELFKAKFHHDNPNSTDVHSVKHIRKLASYLSKYLGKNKSFPCIGELRLIDGKPTEFLYGSPEYKSEAGGKKKGKVIACILGSRVRPITGRLWGCSESLSKIKPLVFNGEMWNVAAISEVAKHGEFHFHRSQWADSYFGDVRKASAKVNPDLLTILEHIATGGCIEDFEPA